MTDTVSLFQIWLSFLQMALIQLYPAYLMKNRRLMTFILRNFNDFICGFQKTEAFFISAHIIADTSHIAAGSLFNFQIIQVSGLISD